jgi:hypothetical protein
MPIARVMNNPDGSTPTPPIGGGDVNGTLALAILNHHAGTGAIQIDVPRALAAAGNTTMGVPGAVLTQLGEPVMQASEGIASPLLDRLAVTPNPPSGLGAQPQPGEGRPEPIAP